MNRTPKISFLVLKLGLPIERRGEGERREEEKEKEEKRRREEEEKKKKSKV